MLWGLFESITYKKNIQHKFVCYWNQLYRSCISCISCILCSMSTSTSTNPTDNYDTYQEIRLTNQVRPNTADTTIPPIYPSGLTIDTLTILPTLEASGRYVYSRPPLLYETQIRYDELPSNPSTSFVRLSDTDISNLYGLSNDEVAYVESYQVLSEETDTSSTIVERFTLLELEYVDGNPATTTRTPQAMTHLDLCGNPFLLYTLPPIEGLRDFASYEIRVFSVPTAGSKTVTDLSNDLADSTEDAIQFIQSVELDAHDPSFTWFLDPLSGILAFPNSAPSLDTHTVYVSFTRYVGQTVPYTITSWAVSTSGAFYQEDTTNATIYHNRGAVVFGKSALDNCGNLVEISGNSLTQGTAEVNELVSRNGVRSFSDRRLKSDIVPITHTLDKLDHIHGVYYTMNQQRQLGLIAQDVLAQFPEAVSQHPNGYYTIDYGNFVGVLVESIHELKQELSHVKRELAELRGGGDGEKET